MFDINARKIFGGVAKDFADAGKGALMFVEDGETRQPLACRRAVGYLGFYEHPLSPGWMFAENSFKSPNRGKTVVRKGRPIGSVQNQISIAIFPTWSPLS